MLFPACYCKIRSAKGEYFVEGRFFTNSPHLSLPHPTNTVKPGLARNSFFGGWCNMGIVDCEITGCMALHSCNAAYPAIMQYVG